MHSHQSDTPMMILGRLLERTEHIIETTAETRRDLREVKERISAGDRRMDQIDHKLDGLAQPSRNGEPKPGPWERIAVDGSRIALWLALLWMTGSAETATRAIGGALK